MDQARGDGDRISSLEVLEQDLLSLIEKLDRSKISKCKAKTSRRNPEAFDSLTLDELCNALKGIFGRATELGAQESDNDIGAYLSDVQFLALEFMQKEHDDSMVNLTVFSDCLINITRFLQHLLGTETDEPQPHSSSLFEVTLLIFGKVWKYICPDTEKKVPVPRAVLNNVSESLFIVRAEQSPKRLILLRLIMEMTKDDETTGANLFRHNFLNWIRSESMTSGPRMRALALYAQYTSPTVQAELGTACADIIGQVRESLISADPLEKKQAAFVLKSVTLSVAANETVFEKLFQGNRGKPVELLLDLPYNSFLNFWKDFFELYDILQERQIHIIEPFLLKLNSFDKYAASTFFIPWYFLLLKKMIQHENRSVAEKGILEFFQAKSLMSPSTKELFFEFINSVILPAVKSNVGWIFPEAEHFFSAGLEMGILLHEKYGDDILSTVELLLGFIDNCEAGLSSLSIFFILECLRFRIDQIPSGQASVDRITFIKAVTQFNNLLLRSLSTVDRYVGSLIQKSMVDIFCKLSSLEGLEVAEDTRIVKLGFLGSLDRETVVMHSAKLSGSIPIKDLQILKALHSAGNYHAPENLKLGYYRMLFILCSTGAIDPTMNMGLDYSGIGGSASPAIEFLKCVLLYGKQGFVWNTVINVAMSDCLMGAVFWTESQVPGMKPIDPRRSLETQELILDYIKDDKHYLEITNRALYKVLQRKTLGSNIYDDYVTLRLFVINTALQLKYSDRLPFCAFEDIVDLFTKTTVAKYGVVEPKPERAFLSEFYGARMRALTVILRCRKSVQSELLVPGIILDLIIEEIDSGGPQGIISALEFFLNLAEYCGSDLESRSSIEKFVHMSWVRIFEMRKSESFWKGLKVFVDLICHPFLCESGILEQYSEEIFTKGELVIGVPLILIEKLTSMDFSSMSQSRLKEIIRINTRATYFGNALMKYNRVTFNLFDYLSKADASRELSPAGSNAWTTPEFIYNAETKIRLIGILNIVSAQLAVKEAQILEPAVIQLLSENDLQSVKHRRYFANSITHRVKQRIAQTLLVLQPLFPQDLAEKVTTSLLSSLTSDSPQPSVRYMMEWVIVKNLLSFPALHDLFFTMAAECCKKRAGVAMFLCSIFLHVGLNLRDCKVLGAFYDKALNMLTNFLMGQHLPVRVYAQICFSKLYRKLTSSPGTTVHDTDITALVKFEIIKENLNSGSLTSGGNYAKTVAAMQRDFWLADFNPELDYNPEAIFIYIPQVAEMLYDEIIRRVDLVKVIKSFDLGLMEQSLGMKSSLYSREKYENMKGSYYHLKPPTTGDGREMGEELPIDSAKNSAIEDGGSSSNLQRKINPWKVLPASEQILDFSQELQMKKKTSSEDGLIVVASLIDRIPNLGGLCRSCEIFGVSKYVISSLNLINDQDFKSLSVSAQSWIDIMEVPGRDLELFLLSYSAKGYAILGIEQAVGSVPLNTYKFPRKSILLLGNEKYGIPTHLLHLVDQCLEIPQVGVVRSLNVHVTGALCIWQYATQHVI